MESAPWIVSACMAAASVLASVKQGSGLESEIEFFAKSYAVVVGVDEYADSDRWTTLSSAIRDATGVGDLLAEQGFEVTRLTGSEATLSRVLEVMQDEVAPRLRRDDRVLFFFAGHGTSEMRGDVNFGYFVPYDASDKTSSWISRDQLMMWSQMMNLAKHQLFIVDACRSGVFAETRDVGVSLSVPDYLQEVANRTARQVLTAGGADQVVLDSGSEGYGYFTSFLMKALDEGLADFNRDGFVVFPELKTFMLQSASNQFQTPGSGVLPGHLAGEFMFRSPIPAAAPRDLGRKRQSGPTRGKDDLTDFMDAPASSPPAPVRLSLGGDGEPYDDDPTQAVLIEPVSIVTGAVSWGSDEVDWYRVQLVADGHFSFEVTNGGENKDDGWLAAVQFTDSSRGEIAKSHHNGIRPSSSATIGPVSVSKGRSYYFNVSSTKSTEPIPYEVKTRFEPMPITDVVEPNDTRQDALRLRPYGSVTGLVGYGDDAQDWYSITAPTNGLIRLTISNLNPTKTIGGALQPLSVDSSLQERLLGTHHNGVGPRGTQSTGLAPLGRGDQVFVRVGVTGSNNSAPYRITSAFTSLEAADYGEPNDRRGNATEVEVNSSTRALIGYADDKSDWYKIRPKDHGYLKFSVSNEHREQVDFGGIAPVTLVDSFEDQLERTHHSGIAARQTGSSELLALAGEETYYLRIDSAGDSAAAPYHLELSYTVLDVTDSNESAGDPEEAVVVEPGAEFEATVGYGRDTVDKYRLSLQPGQFRFRVENLHPSKTKHGALALVVLESADGKVVGKTHHSGISPGNEAQSEILEIEEAGEFFLTVRPAGQFNKAPYALTTTFRSRR